MSQCKKLPQQKTEYSTWSILIAKIYNSFKAKLD